MGKKYFQSRLSTQVAHKDTKPGKPPSGLNVYRQPLVTAFPSELAVAASRLGNFSINVVEGEPIDDDLKYVAVWIVKGPGGASNLDVGTPVVGHREQSGQWVVPKDGKLTYIYPILKDGIVFKQTFYVANHQIRYFLSLEEV